MSAGIFAVRVHPEALPMGFGSSQVLLLQDLICLLCLTDSEPAPLPMAPWIAVKSGQMDSVGSSVKRRPGRR